MNSFMRLFIPHWYAQIFVSLFLLRKNNKTCLDGLRGKIPADYIFENIVGEDRPYVNGVEVVSLL